MSELDGHSCDDQLSVLRTEARALVQSMPGPLQRLVMRSGDLAVEVEWSTHGAAPSEYPLNGDGHSANGHVAALTQQATDAATTDGPASDAAETHLVLAPLVGTCYLAPEPGADPFVVVGQFVEPGQPVAIVEAMKLMNEVTAEVGGRVEEILADNTAAVEFGQPLVRLALGGDGES